MSSRFARQTLQNGFSQSATSWVPGTPLVRNRGWTVSARRWRSARDKYKSSSDSSATLWPVATSRFRKVSARVDLPLPWAPQIPRTRKGRFAAAAAFARTARSTMSAVSDNTVARSSAPVQSAQRFRRRRIPMAVRVSHGRAAHVGEAAPRILQADQCRRHRRLALENVKPGAGDATFTQSHGQRILVHHRTPRGIDEDR